MTETTAQAIEAYQVHFDSIYVAGIPNLLRDSGVYLAFVAALTATDALAGLYDPASPTGERFRNFVARYYPPELSSMAKDLWAFRNAMVHSFNPGPFALTYHNTRSHLSSMHGPIILNAEDFYAALLYAYRGYFSELAGDEALQARFSKRLAEKDGGAPEAHVVSKPI